MADSPWASVYNHFVKSKKRNERLKNQKIRDQIHHIFYFLPLKKTHRTTKINSLISNLENKREIQKDTSKA